MSHVTFTAPDLTTFCCLDELGLEVVGQHITAERAVVACRVVEADDWCRRCGCQGAPRDTVIRRLAHTPWGHRPTILQVRVRRYRCTGCGHVWRQDTSAAAEPRATLSRGGLAWGLEALVLDHLPVSRIAASLGVDWTTANDAVLAEGRRLLIDDRHRFDGVEIIGVDEHVWRHTKRGDRGGFNWSSQHLDVEGVGDGSERQGPEHEGRATGVAAPVACRSSVAPTDAFPWAPTPVTFAASRTAVLAPDRHGRHNGGSLPRGRRVVPRRCALVSTRWRHATDQPGRAVRALSQFRRT
ncbi:ISL3 family transposase [Propionibacterium freudenreichii]|nr:ISL3 family transposase [Propionibacterium freudenreichii]